MATSAAQPAPQAPAPTRAFRPDAFAGEVASGPRQTAQIDPQKISDGLLPLTVTDLNRPDLTGLSLGPWRPGRKLGQGGMGQVFVATHETLGRSFAIKFLTAGLATSQEASQRFQDEIRSIGQMQHPNIVSAVDAGVKNGIHYLVTDYVQGQTLSEVVASKGWLPESKVIDIARQVAAGLSHAHQLGFVHRDIKPSNLMLDEAGTVRILDFGIARHTNGSSSLTADGQMLGTAEFLAPEQAADAQSVDGRSDLYSLGGTLLFLLTGETPFPKNTHPTFASQIHAHLFETPPAITQPDPAWSSQLLGLLTRLLARDPRDRFANADEVLSFLSGRPNVSAFDNARTVRFVVFGTMACAVLLFGLVRQFGGSNSPAEITAQQSTAPQITSPQPEAGKVAAADPNDEVPKQDNEASDSEGAESTNDTSAPEPAAPAEPVAPPAAEPESTSVSEAPELLDVQTVTTNPTRSVGHAPAPFPRKLSGSNVKQKPGVRSGVHP